MGKIKRSKLKLHETAPKSLDPQYSVTDEHMTEVALDHSVKHTWVNSPPIVQSNIFKNVHIPTESLNQELVEKKPDTMEFTVKCFCSKSDMRRAKHELLLEKLEKQRLEDKKRSEAAKRRATPVVGDMQVLADALPDMNPYTRLARLVKAHKMKKINNRQTASIGKVPQMGSKDVEQLHQLYQTHLKSVVDPAVKFTSSVQGFLNFERSNSS